MEAIEVSGEPIGNGKAQRSPKLKRTTERRHRQETLHIDRRDGRVSRPQTTSDDPTGCCTTRSYDSLVKAATRTVNEPAKHVPKRKSGMESNNEIVNRFSQTSNKGLCQQEHQPKHHTHTHTHAHAHRVDAKEEFDIKNW